MTRCGQPGHLTPSIPSGVFPGSLGETLAFTVRCPQSPLASAHRTNKPTLRTNLATQSHGLPLPQCLDQQSFSSSLGLCSPSIQTHRHHLLPTSPISSALPIPALPAVSEQPLLRQRIPFCLAWTAQRPAHVRQAICASDLPRRARGLHKSALPIFPFGGMAATAPMSRPTAFLFKPWTIQSRDPGSAARSHPIPASSTPCP